MEIIKLIVLFLSVSLNLFLFYKYVSERSHRKIADHSACLWNAAYDRVWNDFKEILKKPVTLYEDKEGSYYLTKNKNT